MRETTGVKIRPMVSATTQRDELPTAVTIRIAVTISGSDRTASIDAARDVVDDAAEVAR